MRWTRTAWGVLGTGLLAACVGEDGRGPGSNITGIDSVGPLEGSGGSEAGASSGEDEPMGSSGAADSGSGGGGSDDGPKFDLGVAPDGGGPPPSCQELGNCVCTIPEHVPCDAGTNDVFRAIGLNCPGELQVDATTSGPGSARGIRSSFGNTNVFDPREGTVYAVIGSGLVGELDTQTPNGDSNQFPTHCSDDLGNYDPGGSLPAPISVNDVGGDCTGNPALVGTGDCSNTIEGQFSQGISANDYVEMRFTVQVPPDIVSFSYDFAFSSTEHPYYSGSEYNDMYIGWLESELWTGNVSFDGAGNPISLNAGFLEYTGNAAELAGTCMRQHAATGWLTTSAGVTGGEDITVVFAIFDLSDSILDSYAFIDNFEWGCDPIDGPVTEPEG